MSDQPSCPSQPSSKSVPAFPLCPPVPPVVKILLLPLLVLLAPLIITGSALAQSHSWRVADFKDTISIAADGTALVSEKITVTFVGEWHGIHRTIPVEYPGAQGTNY